MFSSTPASASPPPRVIVLSDAVSRVFPPLPNSRPTSALSNGSLISLGLSMPSSGAGNPRASPPLDYSALTIILPASSPRPNDNLDRQTSPSSSPRQASPGIQGSPSSVVRPNPPLNPCYKCRTPIYLVDIDKWAQISGWMKRANIVITKAKNLPEIPQFFPPHISAPRGPTQADQSRNLRFAYRRH